MSERLVDGAAGVGRGRSDALGVPGHVVVRGSDHDRRRLGEVVAGFDGGESHAAVPE